MATRKDFKLAAAAIAKIPDIKQRTETAVEFAVRFQQVNPNFDRAKFLTAAGVSPTA